MRTVCAIGIFHLKNQHRTCKHTQESRYMLEVSCTLHVYKPLPQQLIPVQPVTSRATSKRLMRSRAKANLVLVSTVGLGWWSGHPNTHVLSHSLSHFPLGSRYSLPCSRWAKHTEPNQ